MAEVITGEFSKFRSNLIDMHSDMKVWLWDCGPEVPEMPEPPEPPSGKEGSPAYDLAKLQYKRKLAAYEKALLKYEQDEKDWEDFQKRYDGPMERMQWSCDARDTLQNDERAFKEGRQTKPRWYLSSRTRGYDKLPNRGLPAGAKPGKGYEAEIDRQLTGEKEFAKVLAADPVFGQEKRA